MNPSLLPGRPLLFGAARQCTTLYSAAGDGKPQPKFKVLGRDLAYSGWRKIVKKTVRFEDEKEHVFDVVHQVPYQDTLLKCLVSVARARVSRCCADGVRSDCTSSSLVLSASLLRCSSSHCVLHRRYIAFVGIVVRKKSSTYTLSPRAHYCNVVFQFLC